MKTKLSIMACTAAALMAPGISAKAADPVLPRAMVWSAYDLGSSGYAEASGIANALQKKYPTRIRIVPAGTSIGRLLPMTIGRVKYGYLANEVFFATEGIYDFAVQSWGPQDLRIVLGRPASNGLGCAADAGITDVASLKGKRIGYVKGNPSVNIKTDAILAFGGLKRSDVKAVMFGSYSALKDAILAGQLDCMNSVTTSSNMRQIEASTRGLYWPSMPADDKAGWERMLKIVSFVSPYTETIGAGMSKEKPAQLYTYRYPMITTLAKTPEDEVYNLVKAIDASFDLFKDTTGSSKNWDVSRSILPPADAPFHPGAIRYAKEKGVWTKEAQEWQEKRLARLQKVREAWDAATDAFNKMRAEQRKAGKKINAKEAWPPFWEEFRAKNLQ